MAIDSRCYNEHAAGAAREHPAGDRADAGTRFQQRGGGLQYHCTAGQASSRTSTDTAAGTPSYVKAGGSY